MLFLHVVVGRIALHFLDLDIRADAGVAIPDLVVFRLGWRGVDLSGDPCEKG